MYIGYAVGYSCNNNGDVAFVGKATSSGWEWEQDNSIAQNVADSISILKNEKVAAFIEMPIRVN